MSRPHIATQTDADRALAAADELKAARRQVRAVRRQMKQIERAIHALVTSPGLTAAQRQDFVGLLVGTRHGLSPAGAPHLYTPSEQRLVENFRAMSGNRRRLVSLLFAALAQKGGR